MEKGNVEVSYGDDRFSHEKTDTAMSYRNQYGVPETYNPADHPPVKLRNHSHADRSETQRKRRSKNRLSNRRSTGFINPETVEEALQMGATGNGQSEESKKT